MFVGIVLDVEQSKAIQKLMRLYRPSPRAFFNSARTERVVIVSACWRAS